MTRSLLLALRAGDRRRIIRALGGESGIAGAGGARSWRRCERVINRALELAKADGGADVRCIAHTAAGIALVCNGRFLDAIEHLYAAREAGKESAAGLVYEQVSARLFLVNALTFLGRIKELRREQDEGLRDAITRGDAYAAVTMRAGNANHAWLAMDRPDLAERHLDEAMADWSKDGFHVEHMLGLQSRAALSLYRGDAGAAHDAASDLLRRMRGSLLWRVQISRIMCLQLYAASALALIEQGGGDREALLRAAERGARAIADERTEWVAPFVPLLRAGIALRVGDRTGALRGLEAAVVGFEASSMTGHAWAVRDRAARIRDDAASASEIARAAEYFRGEEVVAPERWIGVLAPGVRG
jgi:hypothetical protein